MEKGRKKGDLYEKNPKSCGYNYRVSFGYFFGLGPVLMADGSRIERLLTFVVVLLLYLLLGFAFKYIKKL